MTDEYFFDSDCISAFLWVNGECILTQLYPGRIILPRQVYSELQWVPKLIRKIDLLESQCKLSIMDFDTGTEEFDDYMSMIYPDDEIAGQKLIGLGEAAAIALTKKHNGILASNNLSDVDFYVKKFGLKHITSPEIMVEALHTGSISEVQGNVLWKQMLGCQRRLPTLTFSDYLQTTGSSAGK